MNLQSIFYILGIAFMISWFIFIIVAFVFLWKAYRKVKKIKSDATQKVESFTDMGKSEIAKMVLSMAVNFFINRMQKKRKS